jgi:ribosomal protein S6--L-glutamate ligase
VPDDLPDRVYTRMGSSAPPEAFHVLALLEGLGVPCVNASAGLRLTRDKTTATLALVRAGLPVPPSALVGREAPLEAVFEAVPGPPWIIKLPVSTQGSGVMLAESLRSLRSLCDALHGVGQRVLVQSFVAEAAGADVRVLVVGGRALGAMRRQGQGDEFRSNLHRGGRAAPVALTPALSDVAQRAAAALGLEIAGVDLLESDRGPLIIEVNGSPGLEGLTHATERDIAGEVIEYLVNRPD